MKITCKKGKESHAQILQYLNLYHPDPIQALKQEITQFPWLEILMTQPWSVKTFSGTCHAE